MLVPNLMPKKVELENIGLKPNATNGFTPF